jgi:mono/diheme cytochrome c family protein
MNKYLVISFVALLILVAALPVYALLEPARMAWAQYELRQQFVSDAAVMYVENCALCHGASGEGIGPNPPLATQGVREADYDFLYKTIARGRYDTAMAGWHEDEGGIFNDYEIEELVALIRYIDWTQVNELSAQRGLIPPTLPVPDVDEAFLEQVVALDPEQGGIWAQAIQIYAENCTICHGVNGEGSSLGPALYSPEVRSVEAVELARIITEGVPGTMMASWDKSLDAREIDALAAFLKDWDVIQEAGLLLKPPAPVRIDLSDPEEVLALGESIFSATCSACHGESGSGGIGPAINSQQFLTRKSDEQIRTAIVNGGRRPGSLMPAFGDRMTSVEIDALVKFVRAWEPTAPSVTNPRGTQQGGGGPPWLRATPDSNNPITPGQGQGGADQVPAGPALSLRGEVVSVQDNLLTLRTEDASTREAMLGPPWFWSESGIALNPGDRIELEGFESADHMEVNWIKNLTTGQSIQLRTSDGTPVWSQ